MAKKFKKTTSRVLSLEKNVILDMFRYFTSLVVVNLFDVVVMAVAARHTEVWSSLGPAPSKLI